MSNRMKYMTWIEFSERMEHCNTFIIPCGATEAYGPHMPMGSDTLVAEKISELVAQRVNALISPLVEFGESAVLFPYNGTVTMQPAHLAGVIEDLLDSLIHWGGQNFMFLNMHAGNTPVISSVARVYQQKYGIKCAQIDWWRFVQTLSGDVLTYSGWHAHGHASECGTSIMKYLYPELVREQWIEDAHEPADAEYGKYPDMITYHNFRKTAPKAVFGEAKSGTAEKGKAIVDRSVARIAAFMQDEFHCGKEQ